QFTEVIRARLTLADAVKQIIDLDADTAILIRKNAETVVAHNADIPLAVGSAFKLGILAAVEDAVRENKLQWFQSVRLLSMWKSLPTGILQDWPTGSRLTIETLATLMISQSDNTATDALMSLVGRNSVGSYLSNSRPVLSTAEAFRLKNPANSDLLARYRTGSSAEKEKVLDQIKSRPLMEPGLLSGNPVAIDIEWFMTAHELASLIERLQVLPLMTVNAGLATKERWHRVAYKGGSEPGVLNLTTYLEDEEHNRHTVVVTVNNAQSPLDEKFIMETYQAILNLLE
ncbi:MAG: serine hydrolase, partial [Sphaerochaeta sp.]|nr:serine hydrolase [Sphaerochaeta sp.]